MEKLESPGQRFVSYRRHFVASPLVLAVRGLPGNHPGMNRVSLAMGLHQNMTPGIQTSLQSGEFIDLQLSPNVK